MGMIYNLPLVMSSYQRPADYNWKTSVTPAELSYFNDVYNSLLPYAQGLDTDGYNYDDRIGSSTNTDYMGFLLRSAETFSVGRNYHSNSTHIALSKRVKNGVVEYRQATVTNTSGVLIESYQERIIFLPDYVEAYNSYNDLYDALSEIILYPISYRLTNCMASSAPTEAAVGDTVTVPFQFTSGYGIVNPSSDVYVTNNGVVVPSQYSNGVLKFTMPDPS